MLLIYANCALLQCKNEIIQHFLFFAGKFQEKRKIRHYPSRFTLALPDKFCFALWIETELLLQNP
jgi:hypothetical protein